MHSLILHQAIEKAQRALPEFKVCVHPQGGYTLASREVGSSMWTYGISHASAEYLDGVKTEKLGAATRSILHPTAPSPAPAQLSFGFPCR